MICLSRRLKPSAPALPLSRLDDARVLMSKNWQDSVEASRTAFQFAAASSIGEPVHEAVHLALPLGRIGGEDVVRTVGKAHDLGLWDIGFEAVNRRFYAGVRAVIGEDGQHRAFDGRVLVAAAEDGGRSRVLRRTR